MLFPDLDIGLVQDRVIAKRHRCSPDAVGAYRRAQGIKSYAQRRKERLQALAFATASDDATGFEAGTDRNVVGRYRRAAGIPALHARRVRDWSPYPLGKMPDRDLAALVGPDCTAAMVRAARNWRGIPPYGTE